MTVSAFVQGVMGASSLGLGAIAGVYWRPKQRWSAAIMAFGSGTLIAAIAFEITLNVYNDTQSFWPLLIGFTLGAVLFTSLSQYVDEQGGFLRKPAASRRYLFEHRNDKDNDVLQRTAHIELMQHLPETEKQVIASYLKPIYVQPGEVLCHEGDPGDYFYMIAEGEAKVTRNDKTLRFLGSGEIFGEMSLLTGEPRSATVIANSPMELYQLNQENFGHVLPKSPHLSWALSRSLARRLRSSTESRIEAEKNVDRWRQQLMDNVDLDQLIHEDASIIEGLKARSAPFAILIGTLLDNIPESVVIGINCGKETIAWSFLLAVFISNFPEALSSAGGMQQAGTPRRNILALWIGVVIFSGFWALGGFYLQGIATESLVAIAQAFGGGAILAMLASTMMPEAYELGGSSVSYSTIAGFLIGFFAFAFNS